MLPVKRFIGVSLLTGAALTIALPLDTRAIAASANDTLWSKFEATRQDSRVLHQEFDISIKAKSGYAEHSSRHMLIVDLSQGEWREQAIGGGGDLTRLFDGQNLYVFEKDGNEYTRTKLKNDKDEPLPGPYETKLEWGKAKEIQRLPCGFAGKDHTCVILEAPIKPWMRLGLPGNLVKMSDGIARLMVDTETGIWLNLHTAGTVEGGHGSSQRETTYTIKEMSYRPPSDANIFAVSANMQEVKELTPWDEGRIKKQLLGKPAPDLNVTDINGNALTLASLKGKTVLLDFWTTWCPPCQADASSIEKLNRTYGGKNLSVVAVSVSEDRETVEKYLKKHPHSYPIVLSSENQLPRPYQVNVFPTYLIIGPDGTLATAEEGDQGFRKLRKELEKAGLEAE